MGGGNYFPLNMTINWIIWDKIQPDKCTYMPYELAWNSSNIKGKIFRLSGSWNNGGDSSNRQAKSEKSRIHPTQKPIALYKWLLSNYAKPGDKILDTHLGSGSSAIAAHDMGFDFIGCEIDKDYFDAAQARFKLVTSQQKMF